MLLIEKDYRLVKGEGIKCTKTMNAMRSAFDVLLSSFQVYCCCYIMKSGYKKTCEQDMIHMTMRSNWLLLTDSTWHSWKNSLLCQLSSGFKNGNGKDKAKLMGNKRKQKIRYITVDYYQLKQPELNLLVCLLVVVLLLPLNESWECSVCALYIVKFTQN